MTIKYSIIIPTAFNHLESDLAPCIDSIVQYTDLSNVQLVVVANGCTDHTVEYVESLNRPFGCVKLIEYENALGYAAAVNKGIESSIGQYIILLNNDCVLLPQEKNTWIKMLELPFKHDSEVGITGPLKLHSDAVNDDFLVFFCVMINRDLINVLKLNEEYNVGGGEDIEYCIEAKKLGYKIVQVPDIASASKEKDIMVGGMPIFHKAEQTVAKNPKWNEIFNENLLKLTKKYNPELYKYKLSNNFERAVIDSQEDLKNYPREEARYTFAASNLKGTKILEIGCSSGYGLRVFPKDIDYTGVDYDATIIEYAKENFNGQRRKFLCQDIRSFEFTEHFDTIVAFEIIEHLDEGKELAQELKKHCDTLIISTPYKEIPGVWGEHHRLHNLCEKDFPEFDYYFLSSDGRLIEKPEKFDGTNLMLMKWERGKAYQAKPLSILAFVPTKNRYDSLAMTIQSIAMQTKKPDKVLIYDDGEHKDLREEPIYTYLFKLLDSLGIKWGVIFGEGKGQHFGHQLANMHGYDLVWRIDDDEIAEPNVLEVLFNKMSSDVGAVAGAVIMPRGETPGGTSKLLDIFSSPNIQWSTNNPPSEVDHLYSSFLYRAGIANYNLQLSPVAHREETLFTLELKSKGYRLLFTPEAITYHFRQEKGGIREHGQAFFFEHDERIFKNYLESNGIKVISLNGGLGDHLAFLNIIPDLFKKYKVLILGICYPDVFKGIDNVYLVPYAATKNFTDDNVYKWCIENNWKTSVVDAYKKMLGV